jgi:diguanylate cyclase (GGDEF)-like protein
VVLQNLLISLPKIRLTNERELAYYVFRTTALCVFLAFAVDVVNQLVFFESWVAAIRSWIITVTVVVMIAAPVSRTIGKSHLALYRASTIDALTGLLNRGAFLEGADDSTAFIALIIVDIDHFKHVNDSHGHWAGDQVLSAVAHMMETSLGEFGRVGRLGGEEFAVLASQENSVALARALELFRQKVAETPILTKMAAVSVTISAGIATHDGNDSFEHLFARADRALYAAKERGRNRIVRADDLDPGPGAVADENKQIQQRRSPRDDE